MSATPTAVFLSYASQDAEAAKRIADALRSGGVEVWFDVEGGLEHGDEWDAKIRRQIKECVLFIPLISANTQARHEGYFRIEWDLAAERVRGFASGVAFILPIVIDDTREPDALVPDRFRAVQWTKLRGGEVPPDVQARFLKLWSHRTGVLKHDAAQVGLDRTAALLPPGSPTSSRARRGRLGWIVGITIGIAVLGALVWTWQYRNADSSRLSGAADQSVSPAAPMSAVPLSEARQLAAKSRALVDELEMGRAELDAADTLCQRAAELDPIEAEVWAAWASVHASFIQSGFDSSPARREAGRNCAAKALQFDARGFEPRLAQAALWVMAEKVARDSPEGRDAEATLRALLRERPDDPRSPFILGHLIRSRQAENDTEWLSLFERAASHPAMTAKTWQSAGYFFLNSRRWAEADAAADRSLAASVYSGNLLLKLILALQWHGDLKLAKTVFDQLPASLFQEDSGVAQACEYYRRNRNPEAAVTLLIKVPKEWLSSNHYTGPTALLLGLVRAEAGQTEAAQRHFRRALQLVDQRLKDAPNDRYSLMSKALIHYHLGEQDAAQSVYRLIRELNQAGGRIGRDLHVFLDPPDAAIDWLEQQNTIAGELRLNPDYDRLRSQPRFVALLARAEADPLLSPQAKAVSAVVPVADAKSVAVLAFANLSDEKANEYFSDGISEELLNVLAKVPGLKVTARTSSFFFKGKQVPIPEIAAKLGVAYVVEGSVQKAGNRVRITAQLIKAKDGFNVWSDKFDRELKDIFAVQDEIAGLIAKNLSLKMGVTPSVVASIDPEALRLYFEARQLSYVRTQAAFARMTELLTRALELEPRFAAAEASLAQVWVGLAQNRSLLPRYLETDLVNGVTHARKAIMLDPASAEAFEALGVVAYIRGDLTAAETALNQAVTMNPNNATGWYRRGWLLMRQGRLSEALESFGRAQEIDPLVWPIMDGQLLAMLQTRRYAEATALFDQIRTLPLVAPVAWANGALALQFAGRNDEALAAARVVTRHEFDGDWSPALLDLSDGFAAWVLADAGARAEATVIVDRLLAGPEAQRFTAGFALIVLGRVDEGCAVLNGLSQQGISYLWLLAQQHENLATDPHFQKLLVQLNATAEFATARAELAKLRSEKTTEK